jgi:hypothetical protein
MFQFIMKWLKEIFLLLLFSLEFSSYLHIIGYITIDTPTLVIPSLLFYFIEITGPYTAIAVNFTFFLMITLLIMAYNA